MPKWGLTMTEGKVVKWLKPPGASFAQGDELLEIETSKITNVMEAEADGTLLRIVAPEGSTLPIGALLAVIAPPNTPAADIDAFVAGFVVAEPSEAATTKPKPRPRATSTPPGNACAIWRWAAATAYRCCCCTVSAPI